MFAIILDDLRQRYGDKIFLTPEDLEKVTDISKGQQANLRSERKFPIPTRKVGGRVCTTIYELAKYLADAAECDVKKQMDQVNPNANGKVPRREKKAKRGLLEKEWWLFRAHHVVAILDNSKLLEETGAAPIAPISYEDTV